MTRFRFTVRRMMVAVAIVGVSLEAIKVGARWIHYRSQVMKFQGYADGCEAAILALGRESRELRERADRLRPTEPRLAAHYDAGVVIQREQIAGARAILPATGRHPGDIETP